MCLSAFSHTGLLDVWITQTRSPVLKKRDSAQLGCEQTDGHACMFWYWQDLGLGPQLLFYFYYEKETEKQLFWSIHRGQIQGEGLAPEYLCHRSPGRGSVFLC